MSQSDKSEDNPYDDEEDQTNSENQERVFENSYGDNSDNSVGDLQNLFEDYKSDGYEGPNPSETPNSQGQDLNTPDESEEQEPDIIPINSQTFQQECESLSSKQQILNMMGYQNEKPEIEVIEDVKSAPVEKKESLLDAIKQNFNDVSKAVEPIREPIGVKDSANLQQSDQKSESVLDFLGGDYFKD